MSINNNINALRDQLFQHQLDAFVIPGSDPHQSEYVADHWKGRQWISGFTGSAGNVVVTPSHAGLWTDSRYFIQAARELKGTPMKLHQLKIPHTPEYINWILENVKEGGTVGCDGALFSVGQIRRMEKVLSIKSITVDYSKDLLSPIWKNRKPLPANEIFEHRVKFAGKNRATKIEMIRSKMKAYSADYHLVSTLDDIAWIFNIRSSDVESNPVSIAYAVIGLKKAYLFADKKKVSPKLQRTLEKDGIVLKPYPSVFSFLKKIAPPKMILTDLSTTNMQCYDAMNENQIINQPTISTHLKAQKNKTEIKHLKNAMIKDGIALTRLYLWLEKTLEETTVTEVEVAQKLSSLRAEQGGYHGESFAAIVGYKANGAIVHYRPEEGICATIKKDGILLLDSGGQYDDGTTDITRTVAFGKPTAEQKRNFTLVLKGHIGLADLKFPRGTRGHQIEVLARQHLWKEGLNYGHGTGHGVGFFLNVHEGPQAISSGLTGKAATVIEEGMLTSNEPGFYKEGEYGIRIENLVLTVKGQKTPYGQFLEFESVTLFPIDKNLVEHALLTKREVEWLADYHREVYEKLSPHLNPEEKAWLEEKCS
ncbi:MAG: aminopeptidase P family protein [Bacteroidota bacterium]